MKLNRSEKLIVLIINISFIAMIIVLICAFIMDNYILGYVSFIILFSGFFIGLFFNGLYLPYSLTKHPYIENLEEVKELKQNLEKEDVKKIIRNLFYDHNRNVYEIGWMIEKNLNIKLHIEKGLQAGEIKSVSLYLKIDEILGTNTQEFWKSIIRYYYQKPISHYIRDIFILLSLVGGIISLLLIIFYNV
ncbi:MAG: hypothetical protein ACFFD2_12450 [Promethearchaeota archaeon]